jgi:hypothetical protein
MELTMRLHLIPFALSLLSLVACTHVGSDAGFKADTPITFAQLGGYTLRLPPNLDKEHLGEVTDDLRAQIPPRVRALEGQTVDLTGYVLPIKLADMQLVEFVLLAKPTEEAVEGFSKFADPVTNQITDMGRLVPQFVNVAAPQGLPALVDVRVTVQGKFHIRAQLGDDGIINGIYQLEATGIRTATPRAYRCLSGFFALRLGCYFSAVTHF